MVLVETVDAARDGVSHSPWDARPCACCRRCRIRRSRTFCPRAFVDAIVDLLVAAGYVAAERFAPTGPVYAVATVRAGLRQHPRIWIGRTVLVRGTVAGALSWGTPGYSASAQPMNPLYPPPGLNIRIRLVPSGTGVPARMWIGPDVWVSPHLAPYPSGPIVGALRRIPLVAGLFPALPQWDSLLGTSSVFRLTLLPLHGTRCQGRPSTCDDAVLDAVHP